jgi:hypothetical protein
MPKDDPALLAAALVGYQQRRAEIEAKIDEIQRLLQGRATSVVTNQRSAAAPAPLRAQRKRKRRLSPEGRRHIIEALRRRWAAAKAAKKAAK